MLCSVKEEGHEGDRELSRWHFSFILSGTECDLNKWFSLNFIELVSCGHVSTDPISDFTRLVFNE